MLDAFLLGKRRPQSRLVQRSQERGGRRREEGGREGAGSTAPKMQARQDGDTGGGRETPRRAQVLQRFSLKPPRTPCVQPPAAKASLD